MNSLIVFASRHGFTEDLVGRMKERIPSQSVDLARTGDPDISPFDRIIIGGPIYNGILHPAIRRFCRRYAETLSRKRTALFVVGISGEQTLGEYLNAAFPRTLVRRSDVKGFFGGRIDAAHLRFFEKLIVRFIKKIRGSITYFDEESLSRFADEVSASEAETTGKAEGTAEDA